jgi:hypothetical protein
MTEVQEYLAAGTDPTYRDSRHTRRILLCTAPSIRDGVSYQENSANPCENANLYVCSGENPSSERALSRTGK